MAATCENGAFGPFDLMSRPGAEAKQMSPTAVTVIVGTTVGVATAADTADGPET
jgi:hypothetical protein